MMVCDSTRCGKAPGTNQDFAHLSLFLALSTFLGSHKKYQQSFGYCRLLLKIPILFGIVNCCLHLKLNTHQLLNSAHTAPLLSFYCSGNSLLSELQLFLCAIFKIVTLLEEAISNHSKEIHKNVKGFFFCISGNFYC